MAAQYLNSRRLTAARPCLQPLLLCAGFLGLGSAWAVVPDKNAQIQIHTQPEGAKVVALGKTWGVTPLTLPLRDAFPALYRPEQPYIGMAIYLNKEGCTEHRTPIHRRNVPAEIQVTLDCDARPQQANPTPSTAAAVLTPAAVPAPAASTPINDVPVSEMRPPQPDASAQTSASVQSKLEELQELRKSGLISEPEYQRLRARVLDYF